MRISVYSIYILACLMAIGAAILSGIVLSSTFDAQQREAEAAQWVLGRGQVAAVQTIVNNQMARMQTTSEANSRQLDYLIRDFPASAFEPEYVIANLSDLLFSIWVPQVKAQNQLNGYGLTLMYPLGSPNVTYDRTFQTYSDVRQSGYIEYAFAYTNLTDGLCHAYLVDFPSFGRPRLLQDAYSFDAFSIMQHTYLNSDFFDFAQPWSASDGNSYWYFTHMWSFQFYGINFNIQTWDLAITWRDRMVGVRANGSEMIIVDSNDMVMAATLQQEADRVAQCHGVYVDGAIPADCIDSPAATHPVYDIRAVRNALFQPEWYTLNAPPVPLAPQPFLLNGTRYLAVAGTLFSQNNFRITIMWYQPWVVLQGSVVGLNALICSLTILSTAVLTCLGIAGVLHPLMRLGYSMRNVARSLKDAEQDGEVAIETHRSLFREVDTISKDFETIVVDFLGFTSTNARNNSRAPKDGSQPFAVVFTDVQSSTALWGKDPIAMSRCIQAHHDLIRALVEKHQLYEVKTVGDSFMVTTAVAADAVHFALDLQLDFFAFEWQWDGIEDLYEEAVAAFTKSARRCGSLDPVKVWNGLRVRVGIHYGLGDVAYDEVTKGYDYYGTVVNAAARIEALGHGGQVVASEAVMAALPAPLPPSVAVVTPLGCHPLRGVPDPPALVELKPAALADRTFPPLRVEATDHLGDDPHRGSLPPPPYGGRGSSFEAEPTPKHAAGPNMRQRRLSQATTGSRVSEYRVLPQLAEEVARGHSLVRSGVLPVALVVRHLMALRQTLEDHLLPLGPQQRTAVYKTLAKGWGVALPRSRGELATCGLRIAQRMLESPKALIELQQRPQVVHGPSDPASFQMEAELDWRATSFD